MVCGKISIAEKTVTHFAEAMTQPGSPSLEPDVVHFGFKKLTAENWAEKGFPPGFHSVTEEYWLRRVLEPQLKETVPIEIRALFEVARGAVVYAFMFYPLMTLGIEQCFRIAETAACEKRKRLKIGPAKRQRFDREIQLLVDAQIIPADEVQSWAALRKLRNWASHPDCQQIMMPSEVLGLLGRTARLINALFSADPG